MAPSPSQNTRFSTQLVRKFGNSPQCFIVINSVYIYYKLLVLANTEVTCPVLMSKEYEVPSWGATPAENFNLEVLKNGTLLENIVLSGKDHFVVGRQPDACDITLEHPSISRVHAILQYRNDGALMILDMKSAHGTFVNKEAMTEGVYQRLYIGDFVKFGASSRSYIVGGPESHRLAEYDSTNMRVYRQKLAERTSVAEEKKKREEELGVGWGFAEDAVNYEDDEDGEEEGEELPDYVTKDPNYQRIYGEKFSASVSSSEVNEKDNALYDKIRKKEKKIQNMQEEIKRIYMKEGKQDEGLTDGQRAAVERNDKRIEVLMAEVEALVGTLRGKNSQREGTAKKSTEQSAVSKGSSRREDRDDDALGGTLDMTADTADASTNWRLRKKLQKESSGSSKVSGGASKSQALTYEDLCRQRDLCNNNLLSVTSRLEEVERVLSSPRGAAEEVDELEVYLAQTTREEAQRVKVGLHAEKETLSNELKRIERLVKIAAPDISYLTSVREKGTSAPMPNKKLDSNGAPTSVTTRDSGKDTDKVSTVSVLPALPQGSDEQKAAAGAGDTSLENSSVTHARTPSENIPVVAGAAVDSVTPVQDNEDARKPHHDKKAQAARMIGVGSLVESIQWSKPGDSDEEAEGEGGGEKRVRGDRGGGTGRKKQRRGEVSSMSQEGEVAPLMPTVKGPQRPSAATKVVQGTSYGGDYLEGGDRVWAPPKDQTGDGRTALNAKYGY